jgi:hypothetical protein
VQWILCENFLSFQASGVGHAYRYAPISHNLLWMKQWWPVERSSSKFKKVEFFSVYGVWTCYESDSTVHPVSRRCGAKQQYSVNGTLSSVTLWVHQEPESKTPALSISTRTMVKLTETMIFQRTKKSDLHSIRKLNCWQVPSFHSPGTRVTYSDEERCGYPVQNKRQQYFTVLY